MRTPIQHGGLKLSGKPKPRFMAGPLRAGPDVSWISRCRVGDDQGKEGACAIYAMANWSEVMVGAEIPDAECVLVYKATLKALGRPDDDGLTFPEAFDGAVAAGWMPTGAVLEDATFADIINAPLLGGYIVNGGIDNVSDVGCLDHVAGFDSQERGYHALLIPAHGGEINGLVGHPWVWIENSWGLSWGWNGLGAMTEDLHKHLCYELWRIRVP